MNRIIFCDIYKSSSSRISKDTAGGYGTENDLGDNLLTNFAKKIIKKTIWWPNLQFVQLYFETKKHFSDVRYTMDSNYQFNDGDYIFICGSIVCFNQELEFIKKIQINKSIKIFYFGSVGLYLDNHLPKNICIIGGNYDFLFQYIIKTNLTLNDIFEMKIINIPVCNQDDLEFIDWKNFPHKTKNLLFFKNNYAPFIATRGCPYSCIEYCTYPLSQGRKINSENVESVVNRLEKMIKHSKISSFVFRDPVFSINIKYAKSLLKSIGDRKLDAKFTVELHLKNLDDEFIELAKYGGIDVVKFGIEAADDEVRRGVNRFSVTNDKQKTAIDLLNKNKFKTVGMFILCQPNDNLETVNNTIKYSLDLDLHLAQYSIFTPYPGTAIYQKLKDKIFENNFSNFNQYNLVYNHPYFSPKKARELLTLAYTMFIKKSLTKKFLRV